MKPTVRQRRLTLVLAAVLLITTGILAPFGAIQLQRIDGFILVAELGFTAFIFVSRFSLGFYTQRIFSFAASTVVLSALLAEAVVLCARLANAVSRLQRERASKLLSVHAAVGALTHQIRQPLTYWNKGFCRTSISRAFAARH